MDFLLAKARSMIDATMILQREMGENIDLTNLERIQETILELQKDAQSIEDVEHIGNPYIRVLTYECDTDYGIEQRPLNEMVMELEFRYTKEKYEQLVQEECKRLLEQERKNKRYSRKLEIEEVRRRAKELGITL